MRPRALRKPGADASGERRREVAARLAAAGFRLPGERSPWVHGAAGEGFASRLRLALCDLGGVFSYFGLYLATRADLLTAGDCLELAAIPDRGSALPFPAVVKLLQSELGEDPRVTFRTIDPQPLASQLISQSHRARTAAGEPVVVTLLRPGVEHELAIDLELLPWVVQILVDAGVLEPAEDLVAELRQALLADCDLGARAVALEDLSVENGKEALLRIPRVYRRLSTGRLLAREDLGGRRIADLEGLAEDSAAGRNERYDLARRLALVWLRQALRGRALPVAPRGENVEILPDGRLAFVGGPFLPLPAAVQGDLLAYLDAAAALDSEKACTYLLRQTHRDAEAVREEQLFLRLRQVVPFRDGAWSPSGDSLAEHLLIQWRIARQCGYRLRPPALAFCRGLVTVATVTRRLSATRDALREGLEELRLQRSLGELRETLDPRALGDSLAPYAGLLLALPQKLDEVLSLMAKGEARVRLEMSPPAGGEGHRDSLTAVLALAVALGAVVLVIGRLSGAVAQGPWVERAGGVMVLLLGALLLWTVRRAG